MRFRQLLLGTAFAVGLAAGTGGAASAAPLAGVALHLALPSGVVAQFSKWKMKHAYRGRGRHLGWYKKGRHRGVRF